MIMTFCYFDSIFFLFLILTHLLLYTLQCVFIYEFGQPPKPNNRLHPRALIAPSPKTPNPRSSLTSQPHNQSFRLVQWPPVTMQEIQLSPHPSQILKSSLKTLGLEPPTPNEASTITISTTFLTELRI
jgi:hypothetical protein